MDNTKLTMPAWPSLWAREPGLRPAGLVFVPEYRDGSSLVRRTGWTNVTSRMR